MAREWSPKKAWIKAMKKARAEGKASDITLQILDKLELRRY